MAGGGWKEPFLGKAKRDSRFIEDFANKIGWQGLEDEAKHNQENPGHAITKAAEYALAGYLGGLYGGAEAAAGMEAGVGAGTTASTAINVAEQQAAQQAMQTAASGVIPKAGLLDTLASGSSTGKGGLLAQQMGMKMLTPQQPPQQMPMARPQGGGQQAPLTNPYGTSAGNSMGLTEEQKRRLRAQGYQIP
jgi:hypothetical protein